MSSRQAKASHGLPSGQKRLSFDVVPGSKRSKLADSSSATGAPRPPSTRLQHRDASGSAFTQCPICGRQVPLLCINLHLDVRCVDLPAAVGGPSSAARSRPPGSAGRGMEPASLRATGQGRPDGGAVGEAASVTEPRREDSHHHHLPSQQPQKQYKQPAKQQQETRSRQQQAQQQGQHNQFVQQQQEEEEEEEEEEEQKQRAAAATLRSSAPASHAEPFPQTVSAWAAPTAAPADRAGGGVSDDAGETARPSAAGGSASFSRPFHAAMSPPPRPSSSTIGVFDASRDIAGGGGNGGIAAGGGGGGGNSVGGDVGSHSAQAPGLGLAGPAPLHPMFLGPTRSAPGPRMKGDGHAWQERAGRPAAEVAAAADGSAGGDGVQDLADAGGCRASRDRQGRRMQASATPHATAAAAAAAAREDDEGAGRGSFGCGNGDGGGGGGARTGASMVEMGLSVFQPVPHPSLDGQYVVLEFVTPAEEAELLALCDDPVLRPPWSPWSGTTYANATAQKTRGKRWGVLPDYHRRGVAPLEHPLPPLLSLLAERMRARVGLLRSFRPNEANAIDYRRSRGSWLRPHVDDRILSGDLIVNLCLAGAAVMSFGRDKPPLGRQQHQQHREQHREQRPPSEGEVRVLLPPRSLQILSRAARYSYTHAIAPGDLLDERRVSITFRRSEPRPFEKPAQ